LAKWIMPGKEPGGVVVTILLGIAGAVVGGFIASLLGLGTVGGFRLGSLLVAVGGALLLLFGYRQMKSRWLTEDTGPISGYLCPSPADRGRFAGDPQAGQEEGTSKRSNSRSRAPRNDNL